MAFSLRELKRDPIGIARQYALRVTGEADVREKAPTDRGFEQTLKFMQVHASYPLFAHGRELGSHSGQVWVTRDKAQVDFPETVPAYYLPWARGSVYRVTLKPHREVDYFFTANLDGCMISISGSREVPTIYHANSAGMDIPREMETDENALKVQNMFRNVHAFGQVPPYINLVDESPQMPVIANYSIFEYDRGSGQFQKGNTYFKDLSYGAVFGVRNDGEWSFFSQSYQIKEKVDMDSGDKVSRVAVNDARLLWPERLGEPGVHRF